MDERALELASSPPSVRSSSSGSFDLDGGCVILGVVPLVVLARPVMRRKTLTILLRPPLNREMLNDLLSAGSHAR